MPLYRRLRSRRLAAGPRALAIDPSSVMAARSAFPACPTAMYFDAQTNRHWPAICAGESPVRTVLLFAGVSASGGGDWVSVLVIGYRYRLSGMGIGYGYWVLGIGERDW